MIRLYAPKLVKRDEVPATFQEVGIHSGYRKPPCSPLKCILSAFLGTNETLNFWTHFLPFWYFLWTLRTLWADPEFISDSYNWPFMAYMVTAVTWPIVSSVAHLFCVMSENSRHICFFLDYLTLSWYAFGVSIVYHAYSFDVVFFRAWYNKVFPWLSASASVFCVSMACFTRFFENVKIRKTGRVSAFLVPYMVVNVPLVQRIIHCEYTKCQDSSIWQHERHLVWSVLALLLYALHFPECLAPGKFDIVGHSHQLFHICVILALYDQLWACYTDLKLRRGFLSAGQFAPHGSFAVAMVGGVLLANIFVVCFFTHLLLRNQEKKVGAFPEARKDVIDDKKKIVEKNELFEYGSRTTDIVIRKDKSD